MNTTLSRVVTAALALALLATTAGCAGGGDSPEATDGGLATVRMQMAPIATNAAYVLGVEQGIFEKHGIDLQVNVVGGGVPAGIASMQSGEVDVATAATVPVLTAAAKGLPVTVLAPQTGVVDTPTGLEGDNVLMVAGGSPVASAADLSGKKVGVNVLRAQAEFMARVAIDQNGGDSSKVEFIPIDFPALVGALTSGQVDAIFAVEPLISQAADDGARVLLNCDTATPGAQLTTAYTTSDYVRDNPEIVAGLVAAMAESSEYAQAHPDEVRAVLGSYTNLKAEQIDELKLPQFVSAVDPATTNTVVDLMVKYGFIEQAINPATFEYTP